jgi:hypothetical protein
MRHYSNNPQAFCISVATQRYRAPDPLARLLAVLLKVTLSRLMSKPAAQRDVLQRGATCLTNLE